MPRNGTGTAQLANPPFVPATPISSSVANGNNSDIIDMLTDSLARDGQGGMTGQLKAADGTMPLPGIAFASDVNTGIRRNGTDEMAIVAGAADVVTISTTNVGIVQTLTAAKAINLAAPVTVASGATTNVFAAASNNVDMSGTATVTAFDTAAAGITRSVTATGAFTLTHNAVSLILPGGANIVAAAGDTFEVLSLGSGNAKVREYMRATGRPLIGGTPAITVDTELYKASNTTGGIEGSGVLVADTTKDVSGIGQIVQTATGANTIPSGTTGQRTGPTTAMLRFNTTLNRLEYYDSGAWRSVQKQDWDFTSSEQTVTAGSSQLSLPHGLGAIPTKFMLVLRCKTIDAGYAVGDEIIMTSHYAPSNYALAFAADATTVNISCTNNPTIANKSSGGLTTITAGSWRWVARASL